MQISSDKRQEYIYKTIQKEMTNPIKELKNIFVQIGRMFRVKKCEAIPALSALAVYLFLNILVIMRYAGSFTNAHAAFWKNFTKNFCVSGFDPLTYVVLSSWGPKYDIHRHPLLAFFVYPLYLLNRGLISLTGMNLVQFIIAAILLFLVFYSFIFMMRICRDIIGVKNTDAILLSTLLFSCAYIMLTFIVPDHFAPSMFMLLMALYVCGVKIRDKKRLNGWQTMLMLIFTAGTTLSNGAKIVIDALFVEGKRFFRPKYLFCAIAVPCALIWFFGEWEYKYYRWPLEYKKALDTKKKSDDERARNLTAFMDTTSIRDSAEAHKAFIQWDKQRIMAKYRKDQKLPWNAHKGKPLKKTGMLQYSDMTTPRWQSLVDNVFGETIQLHQDHLLKDTLRDRPVFISYRHAINYIVEAAVVLLFAFGIWCGRKSRFLWMTLSGLSIEIVIHLVFGFGLNEVYIMGAHWLFVIPIAMAYTMKRMRGRALLAMRTAVAALSAFLLIYNGTLLAGYFLA